MAFAINCGYARVAALEIAQNVSQNHHWQKDIFKNEKIHALSKAISKPQNIHI